MHTATATTLLRLEEEAARRGPRDDWDEPLLFTLHAALPDPTTDTKGEADPEVDAVTHPELLDALRAATRRLGVAGALTTLAEIWTRARATGIPDGDTPATGPIPDTDDVILPDRDGFAFHGYAIALRSRDGARGLLAYDRHGTLWCVHRAEAAAVVHRFPADDHTRPGGPVAHALSQAVASVAAGAVPLAHPHRRFVPRNGDWPTGLS